MVCSTSDTSGRVSASPSWSLDAWQAPATKHRSRFPMLLPIALLGCLHVPLTEWYALIANE